MSSFKLIIFLIYFRYELQILLRLEILQSKYVGSMKGSMRMKLVKQICSLLEIIQYLVEGGFHGDLSLYDYVERTIKSRYSHLHAHFLYPALAHLKHHIASDHLYDASRYKDGTQYKRWHKH
ncbi:putative treslin [Helianthus anomalus]